MAKTFSLFGCVGGIYIGIYLFPASVDLSYSREESHLIY